MSFKVIHLTGMGRSGWLITSWVINEFENPQRKICRFKNIRILVDGASVAALLEWPTKSMMVCYGIFSLKWSIGLIHYTTLYPTSLHALRTDGIKSMLRGFSGGKQLKKNCQWKKSRLSLFILDNRKWKPFHLKGDDVKIWVEVFIVPFLCAMATVDVFMVKSNDVNLAKTRYVHFAWLWNRRLVLIE